MLYQVNENKQVRIPDGEIEALMKLLDLTKEEAIQTWLEDEEIEINEEQQALTQKAKDNRITATIHQAGGGPQKEKKPRPKKEDPVKNAMVESLLQWAMTYGCENTKIEKEGKLITFEFEGEKYKLDLIRQRPAKKTR